MLDIYAKRYIPKPFNVNMHFSSMILIKVINIPRVVWLTELVVQVAVVNTIFSVSHSTAFFICIVGME